MAEPSREFLNCFRSVLGGFRRNNSINKLNTISLNLQTKNYPPSTTLTQCIFRHSIVWAFARVSKSMKARKASWHKNWIFHLSTHRKIDYFPAFFIPPCSCFRRLAEGGKKCGGWRRSEDKKRKLKKLSAKFFQSSHNIILLLQSPRRSKTINFISRDLIPLVHRKWKKPSMCDDFSFFPSRNILFFFVGRFSIFPFSILFSHSLSLSHLFFQLPRMIAVI